MVGRASEPPRRVGRLPRSVLASILGSPLWSDLASAPDATPSCPWKCLHAGAFRSPVELATRWKKPRTKAVVLPAQATCAPGATCARRGSMGYIDEPQARRRDHEEVRP